MVSITSSVSSLVATTVSAASSSASATSRATPQAGVLEGISPVIWSSTNPLQLFIIQAGIVIILCRLIHIPLQWLGQPRVIAEVIGGIILGPSAMMRIPGFQESIFPAASMPVFSNVANLGLILFLFLIALELDIRLFTQNWRVALSVGLAGMILPFGLGCAIARGLFNQFHNDGDTLPISFGVYALFIGTALAITAFPVLCRILTDLKLLRSGVGVTTLAAGVGNDVTGWILLALCVALVNNSSGLTALWALLCVAGWTLFLVFAVRPCFMWMLRRTGSLQNGPTQSMVGVTLLIVLTSAWFTGIVGVHPIFGGFLAGLICPHDGGFAIKLAEKIEDLVSVLFLPLYFALSGLSTNLGLLDNGITWAYVVGIIAVAFSGKIIGGTLAARSCRLLWRESFSIGVLMSCKGLVELIVLNVGLQAKILSQRTFTMFVVMALVTTVATSPLTKLLYPPWYQKKVERWRRGEIDWDGQPLVSEDTSRRESIEKINAAQIRRLLVYLRLDSLPSVFTFIALLASDKGRDRQPSEKSEAAAPKQRPVEVHGLRILELTERTSSVMQVTEGDEYSQRDPVVNTFKTFAQLSDVAVAGSVVVAPADYYAEALTNEASDVSSDFMLIPWSEHGSLTEDQSVPFSVPRSDRFQGRQHLEFIQETLHKAVCTTGIFINNGFGGMARVGRPTLSRTISSLSLRGQRDVATMPVGDRSHHVFFPFFGGVDDRVALRFVLQLAKNANVTVTIAHMSWSPDDGDEIAVAQPAPVLLAGSSSRQGPGSIATTSGLDGEKEMISQEVLAQDLALIATLQSSLPAELKDRVCFIEASITSSDALAETMSLAKQAVGKVPRNAGDIVIVGRRHAKLGDAVSEFSTTGLRRTVGILAEQMILGETKASVLVIQAGDRSQE